MINLDFSPYVLDRTRDFTGREWVFQAINDWLADPAGSRFFVLKGEPGSGKTAISARLSQFTEGTVSPPDGLAYLHPHFLSALHFCSARDSRWINPRVFAESLALQLAKRYPVYAKALAEKSVDRSIHIEVQQQIGQGQGVGVIINKLDVSGATPEDAFNRVLREPLETLLSEGFDAQVIILVDALDEALTSTITPTIVALLSQTDNLPSHVRFILTTRQESRVENKFRNVKELSLSIPNDRRNQVDIGRYVQGRCAGDLELAAKAEQVEPTQITQFVEVVSRRAEGNFLYARFLLDAMAKGLRSLSELDGLPTGLDELYFDSLNRVVELGKRDWFTEYRPLMGVLSVAQESLTLTQLQAFTAQPESSIWQYLSDLQQFIQEASPQVGKAEQETRYRLYHQSVIDFLGRQRISIEHRQSLNNYYIQPGEWHMKLANVCEQGDLSIIWDDVKRNAVEQSRREYARRYYITHLYLAQEWQTLFEVLNTIQYGQSKIRNDPSTSSYALDLDLGRQVAMWEGWTVEEGIALLPHLWQYTLLRCSLTSRADRYPEEAFLLLILLGRKQEVLGLAELLTDLAFKVRVLQYIAKQLREQASQESEWLELLMRAGEVARTLQDSYGQAIALSGLGTAFAQAGQEEQASQVWAEAERVIGSMQNRSEQAWALIALGTVLAQAGQWAEAERVIDTIQDSYGQARALRALGTALAQAGQWAEAERVIDTIQDSPQQIEALRALGTAFAQAGQEEQASQVWAEAERVIGSIQDSYGQARALRALGTAFAQAGRWAEAERVIGSIQDSYGQAIALRALGTAFAQAGLWAEAERVIDTIQDSNQQVEALRALGTAFAQAGQEEQASQVWAEAERVIDTIQYIDRNGQAEALRALGTAFAQAGLWAEAERVISFIQDSYGQAWALSALGTVLAQAGLWAEAERVIGSIQDSYGQAWALRALGTALAQAGQWAEAERVIDTIQDSPQQVEALSALGTALTQAGQEEQASQVWAEAERVIDTIQDSPQQAIALSDLGTAFAQAGQEEQASQVWAEAERVIDTIQYIDRNGQAEALSDLGTAFAQAGLWAEAERVIGSIQDSPQQAIALSDLATMMARTEKQEQVLHLIQRSWRQAETRVEALTLFSGAIAIISYTPDIGTAFLSAFSWVDKFLGG